jgi:hypothetical protein
MHEDWDWNIIPEDRAEWIGLSLALVLVLAIAWWIFR